MALAILALVLSSAFAGYSSGLGMVRLGDERTRALILAQSLLAKEAARPTLTPRRDQGRQGALTWRLEVALSERTPLSLAKTPWALFQIAVIVHSPSGRRLRLTTLKLARRP